MRGTKHNLLSQFTLIIQKSQKLTKICIKFDTFGIRRLTVFPGTDRFGCLSFNQQPEQLVKSTICSKVTSQEKSVFKR